MTRGESRGQEPFQSLFILMDRNNDGRIVLPELIATLTLIEDLRSGHAILSVKDRGVHLFGNLDASGDGRLGLRELNEVRDRLTSFDRNGDGQVKATEIPHRFELSLSQGPPAYDLISPGILMAEAAPTIVAPGPRWFGPMDRNRDGDLSPREFLGPLDVFRRLDGDGDGLIDAREAALAGTR